MTRRVAIIVGTRPEAIKMAPVILEFRKRSAFETTVISTGQHRELLHQAFSAFGIAPDVDLGVMVPNQTPSGVFATVTKSMQAELGRTRPDAVLVHGDTSSCLASALAAFYERIPVGHVEAGLRTYDFAAPWPEEMNRRLTDPLCRWCFAPTEWAAGNLRAERIPNDSIFVTGNTAVDALLLALRIIRTRPPVIAGFPVSARDGQRIILVTGHRRESFGEPLEEWCSALREIAIRHSDVEVIYPVHLNPNVRGLVHSILGNQERVHLIPPLDYLSFVALLERSTLVVTDSGGIQEEAPTLGKPLLVTRRSTERPEAAEMGLARIIGTDREVVIAEVSRLLTDPAAYARMSGRSNPYGDGRAAERIADIFEQGLQCK